MSAACGFCHGEPVIDASSWLDDVHRPPAPCPRCGETQGEPARIMCGDRLVDAVRQEDGSWLCSRCGRKAQVVA